MQSPLLSNLRFPVHPPTLALTLTPILCLSSSCCFLEAFLSSVGSCKSTFSFTLFFSNNPRNYEQPSCKRSITEGVQSPHKKMPWAVLLHTVFQFPSQTLAPSQGQGTDDRVLLGGLRTPDPFPGHHPPSVMGSPFEPISILHAVLLCNTPGVGPWHHSHPWDTMCLLGAGWRIGCNPTESFSCLG